MLNKMSNYLNDVIIIQIQDIPKNQFLYSKFQNQQKAEHKVYKKITPEDKL